MTNAIFLLFFLSFLVWNAKKTEKGNNSIKLMQIRLNGFFYLNSQYNYYMVCTKWVWNKYEILFSFFLILRMQHKWEKFKMTDFMVCKIKYGKGRWGKWMQTTRIICQRNFVDQTN